MNSIAHGMISFMSCVLIPTNAVVDTKPTHITDKRVDLVVTDPPPEEVILGKVVQQKANGRYNEVVVHMNEKRHKSWFGKVSSVI